MITLSELPDNLIVAGLKVINYDGRPGIVESFDPKTQYVYVRWDATSIQNGTTSFGKKRFYYKTYVVSKCKKIKKLALIKERRGWL